LSVGSVLVVSSKLETGKELCALMLHSGFMSTDLALSANEARRKLGHHDVELIIINSPLTDESITTFVLDICERTDASILVIVKRELLSEIQYELEKCQCLVLAKPLDKFTLAQTAKYAVNTKKSMSGLLVENSSLKKKMDEKRVIDKAKWFLIENLKMTEPQAHRYIQKKAMDLRLPQIEVANDIINSYE
jgi:response regulator NasT